MPEDIIEMLDNVPFAPFMIVTSAGERYRIDDRHAVAMMTGRVFVAPRNEKWAFIKIEQVTAIEAAPKAA